MAKEYLGLVEEDPRGTDPAAGYLFLPQRNSLLPTFEPTDEIRKEFRGNDTALGGTRKRRLTSKWSFSPEYNLYPVQAIGLLLKHVLGFAGARSVIDTSAREGILYPIRFPYGPGTNLDAKAIGIVPNTDEEGVTKSQYYGGARPKSFSLALAPDEEVVLSFEMDGPGPYVGSPDQAALAGVANPSIEPFLFADAKCYLGAGASRTGVGPDFTAIDPDAMTLFSPDSLNLTFNSGLADKAVHDGVAGPNKTERDGMATVELDFSIDYRVPSSGFNSAAEFKKIFTDAQTTSLMIVLEHPELAGDAAAKYKYIFDIPLVLERPETREVDPEGKTAEQKFSFEGMLDPTVGYQLAIWVVDKSAAF